MKAYSLSGRPRHISREQLRAFLSASLCVLAYHGLCPRGHLTVKVTRRDLGLAMDGSRATANWDGHGLIRIRHDLHPELLLTACLHECIHACRRWPKSTDEKCVSTLTARLKADVAAVAEVLVAGERTRAAALAHTRISYVAKNGDHYDQAQFEHVGLKVRPPRRKR